MKKYRVGIIGCGEICGNYLSHAQQVYSDYYEVVAISDLDVERAKKRAEKYNVEKFGTPDIVYNAPDIDIIINLTVPKVHEQVTLKALECGKHVYSEKPLALTREGILKIKETAKKLGLRVGCAPDSFMSSPAQSAKKALEDDWIGKPVGFNAICPLRGNEFHRPDADFFYKKGAGPMFDMAPYYLNIFISLFGAVDSVMAMGKISFDERTIKAAPRRGEKIEVEVPTFVCSTLRFENGVMGTFTNSFDIWSSKTPYIEIYGEKGTMVMPDPNRYQGEVLIKRFKDTEWRAVPQFVEYEKYGRGIGIVDMIRAIESGTSHKTSIDMAYHTTDVILSMEEAIEKRCEIKISSTSPKPDGLWMTPETILWK